MIVVAQLLLTNQNAILVIIPEDKRKKEKDRDISDNAL